MISKANDNESAFADFMVGYWNQMAPDNYRCFGEALADFRATEGERRFEALVVELSRLSAERRFPSIQGIKEAYRDPYWSNFSLILTAEDLQSCPDLFRDTGVPKQ